MPFKIISLLTLVLVISLLPLPFTLSLSYSQILPWQPSTQIGSLPIEIIPSSPNSESGVRICYLNPSPESTYQLLHSCLGDFRQSITLAEWCQRLSNLPGSESDKQSLLDKIKVCKEID